MSKAEEETIVEWAASPTLSLWNDDTFAAKYKLDIEDFFSYLVELNINIYIVEHVFAFPLDLFSGGHLEGNIFFRQVIDNFLDQCVVLITKLVKDDGTKQTKPVYTLRQFKNRVMKALRDEYKEILINQFKTIDFEKKTDELLETAKTIRDTRIAHFTPSVFRANFDQTTRPERLLFSEIKVLRDALNDYYEVLTLGGECFMLLLTYQDNKSDIEWLLDSVAKNSTILNMLERDPEEWKHQRQRLTEHEITHLNHYRKKLGLSEI